MTTSYTKKPWEVFDITQSFADRLDSEDEEALDIDNSLVEIYDSGNNDVTATIMVADSLTVYEDTSLKVVVQGGVAGNTYKICFKGYVSDTRKFQEDVYLKVRS